MDKEKLLRVYNMLNSSDKENMYMGFKILESYDIKTIEEEVMYLYLYTKPTPMDWKRDYEDGMSLARRKFMSEKKPHRNALITHNWGHCINNDKTYISELLIEEHMKDLKRIFKTLDQEIKFKIVYE